MRLLDVVVVSNFAYYLFTFYLYLLQLIHLLSALFNHIAHIHNHAGMLLDKLHIECFVVGGEHHSVGSGKRFCRKLNGVEGAPMGCGGGAGI